MSEDRYADWDAAQERDMDREVEEMLEHRVPLVASESGATATCPVCGTIYDLWGVDLSDIVPPVGYGCPNCIEEAP